MVRPLLALGVVAVLCGCHRTPPPVLLRPDVPSVAGTGWTEAKDAESGVSLDLPAPWRVGVARAFDASSIMGGGSDLGEAGGPAREMGAELQRQDDAAEKAALDKLRKEGVVLHCTDGSKATPAEEPTQIFVKKFPGVAYGTLDEAAVAEKGDLHVSMTSEPVDLPVGKAIRLQAKGRNRIGDEECHVSYVFVDGEDAYALRFVSTNNPEAILSIDRQVAQTFRVAKK